jgi:phage replication-related protein YjqB (UPF0714/DUF867 family)
VTSSTHRISDSFRGYSDLARHQREGEDYRVVVHERPCSTIAILAPHGGRIEEVTSEVARVAAGDDFNLYLFEGIRQAHNYVNLHLTSHRFDEPRCLALLERCDHVIAVHGCAGDEPHVLVGGRDAALKAVVGCTMADAGIAVHLDGHRFPAIDANNICNRGRRGCGVQIEMTTALRYGGYQDAVAHSLRTALLTFSGRAGVGAPSLG